MLLWLDKNMDCSRWGGIIKETHVTEFIEVDFSL
jgi:hypothetical protein